MPAYYSVYYTALEQEKRTFGPPDVLNYSSHNWSHGYTGRWTQTLEGSVCISTQRGSCARGFSKFYESLFEDARGLVVKPRYKNPVKEKTWRKQRPLVTYLPGTGWTYLMSQKDTGWDYLAWLRFKNNSTVDMGFGGFNKREEKQQRILFFVFVFFHWFSKSRSTESVPE